MPDRQALSRPQDAVLRRRSVPVLHPLRGRQGRRPRGRLLFEGSVALFFIT